MGEGELILLGAWPSSYVIRVRMVLEQKEISYEYLQQDLFNKGELLVNHNPIHKKVPVLIHNDRSICESLVILQYIDENWSNKGPSVLPADPYECAMARFWVQYIDEKFVPSFIGIIRAATEEEKAQKVADTLAALELLEGVFEKYSEGKDFFGGASPGFLDITLGSLLFWVKPVENISGAKIFDERMLPLLTQWANRFLELDFVKRVQLDVEKVEEYTRHLQVTLWKVA